ncbi:retrovirus-related pol polyprotein from transposon TNT 1-94 [Tanacetum coccineum]
MSQDVMICVMNSTAVFNDVNVEMQSGESCVKCLDLEVELLNKQNAYNDLSRSYSQLEKHCISLELSMQLNQEIFQKDSLSNNQNALEILEYFENNNLKAQLQAKDTTICKLKEHIKTMRENDIEEKVKHEMDEIETINIELEHSVAKLLFENEHLHKEIEHLKKIYKDQFDSIKKTRALFKEHGDSLIAQLASKSIEYANLKRQIQDKGSNATNVPSSSSLVNDRLSRLSFGTVRFENDQVAKITGYGDYQLGNVIILRVYYVEGLGHNLFSIGQFYETDIEVAFWKNTCFIRNLEGVDLLSGSRDINLYTISLDYMLKTFPICLLSKASKTKSWLWHRRLSHLNFGTLNKLAKDGLARGIPKLKF